MCGGVNWRVAGKGSGVCTAVMWWVDLGEERELWEMVTDKMER